MADLNTILETLGDAVAADSATRSWCQSAYGKNHTVYENCDSRSMPPAEACPLVVVGALEKDGGLGQKVKGHLFYFTSVVHDETKVTSASGVERFTAGRNAEELRKLVFQAVLSAKPAGLQLSEVHTEIDPIDQFPYAKARMEILLTQVWTSGSDPYE